MISTSEQRRTFHYGQEVLYNDKRRTFHGVIAGVGYGKTHIGPPWCEKRRLDNPKSKISLVVAPTYKLLKNRCFAEYVNFLTFCGYKEGRKRDYQYNKSDVALTFATGQEVIGISGDNPTGIISYNASHIWHDESALDEDEVRRRLIMRLRCPDAIYRQMLDTTTPEGLNHIYEAFNPEKLRRHDVISYNADTLVLHGRTHDNPYLDDKFLSVIEQEFGWDKQYYDNYVLGEFVNLSRNAFYFRFDERDNTGEYAFDDSHETFDLTWDANVGQMTWAVIQSIGNAYYVRAENGSNGRNIHDACQQFIDRFPPAKYRRFIINVYGDATIHARSTHSYESGYEIIESILKPLYPYLTIQAHRGNPFVEERSRCTNKLFAEKRLFIDRNCRKTIASAKQAETDKKGGIKKSSTDTVTHAMEAVDMALICREPLQVRYASNSWS